jgi:hypothetical protein
LNKIKKFVMIAKLAKVLGVSVEELLR